MKRFYHSKRKGEIHIFDRELEVRIAKCDFRECAEKICFALNYLEFEGTKDGTTDSSDLGPKYLFPTPRG